MNAKSLILVLLLSFLNGMLGYAQKDKYEHIEKRYNIFFRINSDYIDPAFKNNQRAIEQMYSDIESTLYLDGAVPDSLLILSTASPDGSYEFNGKLAMRRAASTKKLILEMFPQFENANIKVEFLEEDWAGLRQVLRVNPEFPQREEMMAVIEDNRDLQAKEWRLRNLKEGWRYLVDNFIYALRNSSITLTVVRTATNAFDEFVTEEPARIDTVRYAYAPKLEQNLDGEIIPPEPKPVKYTKTIMAARTNLLVPGMNFGLEFPIRENWSIGLDYYYPWFVSKDNLWCVELLGWFVDAKYWFTNDKTRWLPDSKLKGHAIGVYGGLGYYDFQSKIKGAQGEFVDFGVDYTYALPVADDKLRLEFNLGIGMIRTWYRPYAPSSDYDDLIKEPGVKYRTTNFVCPTMAGVSLVWPITIPVKNNPYLKIAERNQRKEERKNNKAGGDK